MLVGSSGNHVTITNVTRLLVLGRRTWRWALILIVAGETLQLNDDNDHRTMGELDPLCRHPGKTKSFEWEEE